MGIFVGIDLGTTFSACAFKKEHTLYAKNEFGKALRPSVVSFEHDSNNLIAKINVGQDAVELEEDLPYSTIRSSKRFIGENVSVHSCLPYTATEIATYILDHVKSIAENTFGDNIDGAVITVPAYFNQSQRHETKIAAEKANLNVLRIINEPTAAALAYGDNTKLNELVLIYDLGGGTFDVTILKLTDDNVYQVLSTSGDTKLGGDDFDNLISNCIKSNFPENFKPFSDFEVRLKQFAEHIKIQLNFKETVKKTLKYCGTVENKIYHHKFEIDQKKYSTLIQPLLLKTKSHVLNALNDADKKISHLDKIILVGGSTKSIFVRNFVEDNFKTKIFYDIDPDLTVATGAANLASSLQTKLKDSVILIDVTPLSLGIETKGGLFDKVIHRNTSIPHTAVKNYSTSFDNQDSVNIKIFQGERPLSKNNHFLGEFNLSGFPKRPKGQTIITIKFDVDVSGLIHVTAFDKITGENAQVTLKSLTTLESTNNLDDAELYEKSDIDLVAQAELENLRQQVEAIILKKILKGENENELRESFDACKENLDNLLMFALSLRNEN
jgi:molecular chaperone DnaK